MTKWAWVYDPHSGGTLIPPNVQEETRKRILTHAKKLNLLQKCALEIRFKSQFCYIDAYENGDAHPTHLCRLRYFSGRKEWSLAFYTYSAEKYEPCVFHSGEMCGTPEEALEVGMVYLE
jgi:hypothetical protein